MLPTSASGRWFGFWLGLALRPAFLFGLCLACCCFCRCCLCLLECPSEHFAWMALQAACFWRTRTLSTRKSWLASCLLAAEPWSSCCLSLEVVALREEAGEVLLPLLPPRLPCLRAALCVSAETARTCSVESAGFAVSVAWGASPCQARHSSSRKVCWLSGCLRHDQH